MFSNRNLSSLSYLGVSLSVTVWRRQENICGVAPTTESPDGTWPCSVWNWRGEMELNAAAHVICCEGTFSGGSALWWNSWVQRADLWSGAHKSSLGLAHDWGRLSLAAQPQPNSSNPARSRPVCSPEPWASAGSAAGPRASDIIPFHCHPSHLFAF